MNYGLVSSYSVNPIEKKPLFHYHPGSYAATIGSFSCNFKCPWCQNWEISKIFPTEVALSQFLSPNELKKRIMADDMITGISISFNEPTLSLEYALNIFKLLEPSVYKMFVTNGYMTYEALDTLIKTGLTGMSVTIKGDASTVRKYCQAQVEKVWEKVSYAVAKGVHVEIICLLIPSVNDNPKFYETVSKKVKNIDNRIPLHFTQFYPSYEFTHVPNTPVSTLEQAHEIAKHIGLDYVYLGNVFGHPLENTYCPTCQTLLIKRTGLQTHALIDLKNKKCPNCGHAIYLRV